MDMMSVIRTGDRVIGPFHQGGSSLKQVMKFLMYLELERGLTPQELDLAWGCNGYLQLTVDGVKISLWECSTRI